MEGIGNRAESKRGGRVQNIVTFTDSRMKAGSMVMPKPGPDGTRTMPSSTFSDDVSLVTGMSELPLNSVNGTGLGMQPAKKAASRYPNPEPDMCGVHSSPAACAIRATLIDRMNPP